MRAVLFPVLGIALACAGLAAQATTGVAARHVPDPEWLKLPTDRLEIGSMHGDVAVSAAGEVYISVEGSVRQRFAILRPNPVCRHSRLTVGSCGRSGALFLN